MIQDSGDRRQFESGAVRDMAEGKGRCDLMPLHEVAEIFDFEDDSVLTGNDRQEIVSCFNSLSVCADEKEAHNVRYVAAKMAIYNFCRLTNFCSKSLLCLLARTFLIYSGR